MNIVQASKILHKDPQSLRMCLQRGELKEIGIAYRNNAGTGWKYLINETEVMKYKRSEDEDI